MHPVLDDGTAEDNPVIISIFNHQNVGHKKHARPQDFLSP